jgi:hypothetical protein
LTDKVRRKDFLHDGVGVRRWDRVAHLSQRCALGRRQVGHRSVDEVDHLVPCHAGVSECVVQCAVVAELFGAVGRRVRLAVEPVVGPAQIPEIVEGACALRHVAQCIDRVDGALGTPGGDGGCAPVKKAVTASGTR